jgi:reactive intermediate/imine deaminase
MEPLNQRKAGGLMAATRREIRVEALPPPLSHYTDVVQVGDLLFLSGAGPVNRDGNLVGEDDVTEQTRQVLRNMRAMLEAADATFADIAKVTVYVIDVEDLKAINVARREFFGAFRPASTLIGVNTLAIPGMRVEIDAIAVIGSSRQRPDQLGDTRRAQPVA